MRHLRLNKLSLSARSTKKDCTTISPRAGLVAPMWRLGRDRPASVVIAADECATLENASAQFFASKNSDSSSHLRAVVSKLLDSGRSHVIQDLATRLDHDGQDLLDVALDCAQRGEKTCLFAIPVVFSSEPDAIASSFCVDSVTRALPLHGIFPDGNDVLFFPELFTHAQLNALNFQGVHDLRVQLECSLKEKITFWGFDSVGISQPEFNILGSERILRWTVGLCKWSHAGMPEWLACDEANKAGAVKFLDDLSGFSEGLSRALTIKLGSLVEVGVPANFNHQAQHGAINEAANSLLCMTSGLIADRQLFAQPLRLKIRSFDSSSLGRAPSFDSLTRIHLQMQCAGVCIGSFYFNCRSSDAPGEIEDLVSVLRANVLINDIDGLQHSGSHDQASMMWGSASSSELLDEHSFEDSMFSDFKNLGKKSAAASFLLH